MRKLARWRRLGEVKPETEKRTGFDRGLLFITFLLLILGIIAIADSSAPMAKDRFNDSYFFVKQQLVWGGVGLAGMFVASLINYKIWKALAPLILMAGIFALIAVLIPGLGVRALGARRWINLGGFGFQPSEIIKFCLVVAIAYLGDSEYPLYYGVLLIGLISFLVMLQPDLGTTIILVVIGMVQIFVAGLSLVYMIGAGAIAGILGSILILASDYRKQRLLTFLSGGDDPLGTGYHIRQILIALGSGGIFGVGLGQSRQKFLFLPESATDSVFAVIGEELGFVGSTVVILLLTIFLYRTLRIAAKAPDTFSYILATGIAAWIGVQSFLNISAMVALVPLTGVPLPFFSYGGSSLTIILFSIGILLNISKHEKATTR